MPSDILAHPKTDREILEKVKEFRRIGIRGSSNQFDRMRKSEDFTLPGGQWDAAVVSEAKRLHKFTLEIPIVKPQIKQIAGSEIQNPQDFIVDNTTEGSDTIARVFTALLKQVADSEKVRYEKSTMFESALGSGQGVLGVFIDKTTDPKHANLLIQKLNEHHVLFDDSTVYDPNRPESGSRFAIWDEAVPKDEVDEQYPDKKDELVAANSLSTFGAVMGNISGIIRMMVGRTGNSERNSCSFGSRRRFNEETVNILRYWKTHTWWKEFKKCVWWFDNRKSELEAVFLCTDEKIKAAKDATKKSEEVANEQKQALIEALTAEGVDFNNEEVQKKIKEAGTPIFTIEEVNSFVMHHTITNNDVFLEDRIDELNGVQMFPLVPFWPHWVNGYKSGIAEDLIGTQEEINWTHSMALNQVKQMSYPPVVIGEDSTGDKKDELRNILNGGARAVIDKSDYGDSIEFVPQPQFPTVEVFTQQAMNNVKTITGRLDIPESNPKSLSGKAKLVDVQKTQQGSMTLFSNYNHSLSILGNLIIEIIRKNDIFSDEEILATVDGDDLIDSEILEQAKGLILGQIEQLGGRIPPQPKEPNPIRVRNAPRELQAQMLDKFQEEMAQFQQFVEQVESAAIPIARDILIGMIHQMNIGKYNTKITMSPMAETMRTIKALQIFEAQKLLLESGDVGLDGEDLIDALDVPNTEKLKAGRQKKLQNLARVG